MQGDDIYTSDDSGATWTDQVSAGSHDWPSITSSADGTKLAAVVWDGDTYTSSDSGATWTDHFAPYKSDTFIISANGTSLIGRDNNSNALGISHDNGATWQKLASFTSWVWSGNVHKLVAQDDDDGTLHVSTDSGATWTTHPQESSWTWDALNLSPDGSRLYGSKDTDCMEYVSTNDGDTWVPLGVDSDCSSIGVSADGQTFITYGSDGYLHRSADDGTTWTTETSLGTLSWQTVAMSADGTRFAAGEKTTNHLWINVSTPSVSAQSASVTATGATLQGTITNTGGTLLPSRGFVYGTNTAYGATTTEPGAFSNDSFSTSLSGLVCGSMYHFAAYALNGAGIGYSPDTTFTTEMCPSRGGGIIVGSSPLAPMSLPHLLRSPFNERAATSSMGAPILSPSHNFAPGTLPPTPPSMNSTPLVHTVVAATQHDHQLYDTGADIRSLQVLLNTLGFTVSSSGGGAPGHETTTFGTKTLNALKKFQIAHHLPASGYLGPRTRALIQSLPTSQVLPTTTY